MMISSNKEVGTLSHPEEKNKNMRLALRSRVEPEPVIL
jgi:hypothetical protein